MEDNRIRRCLVSEKRGLNTQITTNTTKKRRFKMHYSAYLSLWTKIGENNIFNFSVTKKMLIITKGWNTVSKDLTLVSCTFLFVFYVTALQFGSIRQQIQGHLAKTMMAEWQVTHWKMRCLFYIFRLQWIKSLTAQIDCFGVTLLSDAPLCLKQIKIDCLLSLLTVYEAGYQAAHCNSKKKMFKPLK